MIRFYTSLWISWVLRVSIESLFFSLLFSFLITFIIYIKKSFPPLDDEVLKALWTVFVFWFPISWSLSLLLALFRSLKYIFTCKNGYSYKLYSCDKKEIKEIGYGDLVSVWRKWFMLIIWMVAGIVLVLSMFFKLFFDFSSVFDWFNIWVLFIMVLVSGFFSFIFLPARCQKVKVLRC